MSEIMAKEIGESSRDNLRSTMSEILAKEIGDYFLDLWYKSRSLHHDGDEELPTALGRASAYAVVSPDKLSMSYPNIKLKPGNAGVARANHPAPMKRPLYYFEVSVKNSGEKALITVGFATAAFVMFKTLGLNGVRVGLCNNNMEGPLFPVVSAHSPYAEVTVNFGQDKFMFNLEAYEVDAGLMIHEKIDESIEIPQYDGLEMIRSYLQHSGYGDTLRELDKTVKSTMSLLSKVPEDDVNEEDIMYALNHRTTLRQLIHSGNIDETFSRLREWYPQIIQDDSSTICFMLQCQKYIEFVRNGMIEEAVLHGTREFEKFKIFDDLVKDCEALIQYDQPKKSYLLANSHRDLVGDAVNAAILATNPDEKEALLWKNSSLERVMQQVKACSLENRFLEDKAKKDEERLLFGEYPLP